MGQTYKFQAHSVTDQHTEEPTINYSTTSTGVSQYKNVDGKTSTTTSGVTQVKTKSKDAGVMYGGISIAPDEIDDFVQEVEGEQAEQEESEEADSHEETPSESFDDSTNMVLDDLDRGDVANAINQVMSGEMDDEKMIQSVQSLGFSDKESAYEVASNLYGNLSDKFAQVAEQEGLDTDDAWNMLSEWNNRSEATKALHDWYNARGTDSARLRSAIREAFNAYGRADNQTLVDNLKDEGYEVRKTPSGGIAVRGNHLEEWTTWTEFRTA